MKPPLQALQAHRHRYHRWLSGLLASVLFLVLVSCTTSSAPTLRAVQPLSEETLEALAPQPPALPVVPATKPLPSLAPPQGAKPSSLGTLALASSTDEVELRLLVIAATEDDFGIEPWQAFLDQAGVPYELLIASQESLTAAKLVTSNGVGRFQGILLTSNNLAYEASPGSWQSAFSQEEWDLLFQYEREFGVRQVSLYTNPGLKAATAVWPEDYGIRAQDWGQNPAPGYTIRLTSDGQSIFPYLKLQAQIPVQYAWTHRSELIAGSTATPLLKDAAGNILGVTSTSSDGRERLALTFAHNPYLLHSQLLSYGLIRWVTKGVFLGERRYYLGADVDDWFIPTGRWSIEEADIDPDALNSIRMP